MQAILPLLSYLIPLIGKGLLMLPVVPNKIIPLILAAFNVFHKYWLLLGFPAFTTALAEGVDERFAVAGFGAAFVKVLPLAWGIAEQYLFHSWYEGKKVSARATGGVSWWEAGKSDIFQKAAK